jgi:hypothetical protein
LRHRSIIMPPPRRLKPGAQVEEEDEVEVVGVEVVEVEVVEVEVVVATAVVVTAVVAVVAGAAQDGVIRSMAPVDRKFSGSFR